MSFIEIIEEQETFELKGEVPYFTDEGEQRIANFGDSVIICRRFGSEEYRNIRKKYIKRSKDKQGRPVIWVDPEDELRINDDLLDYIIVDWKNVISPTTKKPIPCTRENKLRLPGKVKLAIIQAADAESVTGLAEETKSRQKEEELKN